MKILLISIDLVLGTRILINVLKKYNFKVQNLQITEMKYIDTFSAGALRKIYEFSKGYDVVGLSFNSFNSIVAAQLGKYLKSKGIKWLIAGGPHTTAIPEEVMTYADIAVIYEAELTLPKLLEKINNSFRDINGIVFKDENGQIVNTGCPKIESNLDNIPFQSISHEDITYYNFTNGAFEKPTIDKLFPHGGRNYFIMTSRGCPFKCTYCCNNLFRKLNKDFMRVRKRSVQNVILEMEMAKQASFKGFFICDDNFLAFTREEIEIFSKLYRTRINLPFAIAGLNPNNMRAKNSREKIGLLLNSGLSDIRIGVQSGSNKTLEKFRRNYTSEELPKLLSVFENRKTVWRKPYDKLRIAVDFICDSPWENEEDKLETLKLANSLLTTYGVFFNTLTYFPGTDIYELALKEGWVKDRERDIYLRSIVGVEDNIYNRLLFLIAILKERGSKIPEGIILWLCKGDPELSKKFIDFLIQTVNDVERHHCFNTAHLTIHPYLKGFNKWKKTFGQKGKRILFRSYHEPYG